MTETGDPAEILVIDTCSILELRRGALQIPQARLHQVFAALGDLVAQGRLVYPRHVLLELERQTAVIATTGKRDLPYEWAKEHDARATRHGTDFAALREVLAIPGVQELLDPDKIGVEPADPYVLALAHCLRTRGHEVSVITEDRKNAPDKIALASACGLAKVPVVPIGVFLMSRGIWRRPR